MKKKANLGPCRKAPNSSDTSGGATIRTTPKDEFGALRILNAQRYLKTLDDRDMLEARRRQKDRAKITLPHVSLQNTPPPATSPRCPCGYYPENECICQWGKKG